ncbi:S-layer homology domain-containing protein [Pueribacillus theae]|uniref:S-layer homology domain-containing protein n=1 Tax=Pueribacillus theae TaxID=2171751 RepID=UPI0023E86A5C|nr:S-layer homology domain-containing protein [Pueribacillus theae]
MFTFLVSDVSAETTFTDVNQNNSHYEGIMHLTEKNIINGYTLKDGTKEYRPDKEISRIHTAVLFKRALELPVPKDVKEILKNFKDINSSHDYANEIAATYEAGIFKGSNGYFNDKKPLTREQMASVLVRAFHLDKINNNDKNVKVNLKNVDPSHQANLQILANLEITNQLKDFRPNQMVTRGQFATFLYRTMQVTGDLKDTTIVKVHPINDIVVTKGEKVVLPETVTVTYNNGKNDDVAVKWDTEKFDFTQTGTYELIGKIKGADVTALIVVVVESELEKYKFLEINTNYVSPDNKMTVRINSIDFTEHEGHNSVTINYTEKNDTKDQVITSTGFKIFFKNGNSEPQYGFFNNLYPGQEIDRSYTFKFLKSESPFFIEYADDNFFTDKPLEGSLKWKIAERAEQEVQNEEPKIEEPSKIELLNNEYDRHQKAIGEIKEKKDEYVNSIENKIKQIRRESPVGYYSDYEYEKLIGDLLREMSGLQSKIDLLASDNSYAAQTERKKLEEELSKINSEMEEIQIKRQAQLRIQNLEDMLDKYEKEYKNQIDQEYKLHESNLNKIKNGMNPFD